MITKLEDLTHWESKLIAIALQARENAYVPYSNFKVGAALLCDDDMVFDGCNIENSAYGPSNCAERTAFFKAISEGHKAFKAIAIVGGQKEVLDACFPCGVCRQVMSEFCDQNLFKIVIAKSTTDYKVYTLAEMLPYAFSIEE